MKVRIAMWFAWKWPVRQHQPVLFYISGCELWWIICLALDDRFIMRLIPVNISVLLRLLSNPPMSRVFKYFIARELQIWWSPREEPPSQNMQPAVYFHVCRLIYTVKNSRIAEWLITFSFCTKEKMFFFCQLYAICFISLLKKSWTERSFDI